MLLLVPWFWYLCNKKGFVTFLKASHDAQLHDATCAWFEAFPPCLCGSKLYRHECCLMQSVQWNGYVLLLPMSICSYDWQQNCCWTVPSCHKEQKDKCVCPSHSHWHTLAWSDWIHQTQPRCSDAVNIVHAHSCQCQPPAFCSLTSGICTTYIHNNVMYMCDSTIQMELRLTPTNCNWR